MGRVETSIWDALLPPGTPEGQRRAVTARERLVTVGAGAGTGKTWVLSNRYAGLLLTEGLLPRDILTLTFTEAAADEMRQRIEARVRELTGAPGATMDSARGKALTDGFGEAWISTIHAFAARVIHESGLSLDIDPRASVISGPQEEDFWNGVREAVEFARMGELAASWGDPQLREAAAALDEDPLLSAAVGQWGAAALAVLARETAELHASLGNSWEQMMDWAGLALTEEDPLVKDAWSPVTDILRVAWRQIWDTWAEVFRELRGMILEKGMEDRDKGKNSANARLLDCMERWEEAMNSPAPPGDGALRAFCLEIMDKNYIKAHGSEPFASIKEFLGATLGKWRDAQPEREVFLSSIEPGAPFPEPERRLRATLLRFCATAWGLWDRMKARRGLLSFSDMILHARALLGAEGGKSQEKPFRHILVDEFQDTDPLQFEMIEALAGPGEAEGACLFAVGDPKQSIYRFRHAEPALFARTIARASRRVELDVSFRTRASLLAQINGLFSHVWANGLGASGDMARLKFEPLSPAAAPPERDAGTVPPLSVLLAVKADEGIEEMRKALARELARRIAAWVREGRTVWDKGAGALRPVRYGDFAVLVEKRKSHELVEEALTAEGVPSLQDRSRGYFARGEVGDVICLLRAAADGEDETALAGWLLSPFSGVPEDEALRCLEAAPKGESLAAAVASRLPDAFGTLTRLSRIGRQLGPAALLSQLDRDRRWLERYVPRDRLRALRNVRHALSIARAFQRGETSSLTACADWMAHALRRGVVMEEPAWRSPGADAVLLSTIHASKGLEYPIAILFDASSQKGGGGAALRPSRDLGLTFSALPDDADSSSLTGAKWEALLSARGEREEDLRLFYVAATRARDALLCCGLALQDKEGALSPLKGSWTELLLEYLKGQGRCGEDLTGPDIALFAPGEPITNEAPSPAGSKASSFTQTPPVRPVLRPSWEGVALSQFSATSFALFQWCPLAWRMRYRQGLDLRWESPDRGLLSEGGRGDGAPFSAGGAELGSLAHWILARWPSGAQGGDDEAELDRWLSAPSTLRRLPSSLRDVWRDERAKEALREWLLRFAASGAGAELWRALGMGARREARFSVDLEGLNLVGAMDAVWEEDGLWRVMDYKITLMENAPPGLYEAQLDFYALVARLAARLKGEPCEAVEVELVFLREGTSERRRRDGGWEDLRARVLGSARLAARGDGYEANLKRCAACPWRRECALKREGR